MEGNKSIQEFMGWKLDCLNPESQEDDKVYQFHRYENGEIVETDYGGDSWSWSKGDEINFNSWFRIMDVVEKIETMDYGFKMCRKVVEVYIDSTKEVIIKTKESCRLNSLYKAVVQFIEWHNKNKSK